MDFTLNLPYRVRTVMNEDKNHSNFTIAFITYNNEERVQLLLNSLNEFISSGNEVIALDLNSTDRTFEIASNYGVRIERNSSFLRKIDDDMKLFINDRFQRNSSESLVEEDDYYIDYGSARQYLQTLSSNDMILMIDVNSEFSVFNIDEIKQDIYGFNRIEFTIHNKKNKTYAFYDRKNYNWCNIVDEQLIPNEQENVRILSHEVLQVISNNDELTKYYYNGLLVDCFIREDDVNVVNKLSDMFFEKEWHGAAYNLYNRSLELTSDSFERSKILCKIANYFLFMKDGYTGIDYYHKAYMEFGDWRTPFYKIAEYYYFNKNYNKCIVYAEACNIIDKPNFNTHEPEIYYKDGLYSMLYVAYWWIGKPDKGKYYFDKALEISPYNNIYLSETEYHYEYLGNAIPGYLTFQDTQYLFNISKKYKSILEIYPDSPRATHALTLGCDGMVTVISKYLNEADFRSQCENPGNLCFLDMTTFNALEFLKDKKFDMVILHNRYSEIINDNNQYMNLIPFENMATKLFCGTKYSENKELIDTNLEIDEVNNDIWIKNISVFEKTIIYTKKQ